MGLSTTELIKEKLNIVDFLRGYLNVQPAGKNFKANCPFHREKTPSFMISPDRQSWHCFGCGVGGDIFAFLMKYENLEFGDALRILAEKAGVELRRLNPAEYKLTGLLYELNDKAKDFFKNSLRNSEPAKKYLVERKINKVTIDEFELGWAPNEPEALSMHLLSAGYSPDDLLRAGLAIKTERGLLLDRFRGRIMFPIHNHSGKVVGFTGRVLPQFESDKFGKYVNSPETPIFNKSKLLYGFWKSKNFIRESGSVFLVEGQMDMLMSWQAGINNSVATSGTALTEDHLRTLNRLTDRIVLNFDSDDAGSAAAERAIDLAEANDFSVKVVALKDFKDPAEAAASDPELLKKYINEAVPAPKFYFEKYLPETNADYRSRENLKPLRIVLGKLAKIASVVERNSWIKELSKITGLEGNVLFEEMDRVKPADVVSDKQENSTDDSAGGPRYNRRELISEKLLCVGAAAGNYAILDDCKAYLSSSHKKILDLLRSGEKKSSDSKLDETLGFILLGAENLDLGEVGILKSELKKEYSADRRKELVLAVKRAENVGDGARLVSALEELRNFQQTVFES